MLTLTFAEGEAPPDARGGREANIWRDEHGQICARGFVGAAGRWMECPGLGVFAFDARSTVVRAWLASGTSPNEVADRFTRTLLPPILQAMGWQALHASGVAGLEGTVALCGVSGSGKSTLAYALGQSGFNQTADDGVVIRVGRDGVFAHPVPFAPKLRGAAAMHFGLADPAPINVSQRQYLPLKVIVLLHQDARRPDTVRLDRVRPTAAFPALVTHAHSFDPDEPVAARQFADDYLSVAARVPVFSLSYHPNVARLAHVLTAVTALAAEHGIIPVRRLAPVLP
ncbi:MAG TPA: hypothetical protein VES67_25120 [Vicinamibacterales bacterium]|nr:hypothetical protein [Vicinamibacterales bacterium]